MMTLLPNRRRRILAGALALALLSNALPVHAQLEWLTKASKALNPRFAKLNMIVATLAARDYAAAAPLAEALVAEDQAASRGLVGMLNMNHSELQQSAQLAAQAQEGNRNYARAIELQQLLLSAIPAPMRGLPVSGLGPKLDIARLQELAGDPAAARRTYEEVLAMPGLASFGMAAQVHQRYGQMALRQGDWAMAESELLKALDTRKQLEGFVPPELAAAGAVLASGQELAASRTIGRTVSSSDGQILQGEAVLLIAELQKLDDPLSNLAEVYWRSGQREALAGLYRERFLPDAEAALKRRQPWQEQLLGLGQRDLELRYARMGMLLAGADLDQLAAQAFSAALRLNAGRIQVMARSFDPETLEASMRARHELLDLALSLQLRAAPAAQAQLWVTLGTAMESKGLHGELLAARWHAVAMSSDPEVGVLWQRLNTLSRQGLAQANQRIETSIALQKRVGPQLSLGELGQGQSYLDALRAHLNGAQLLSVLLYSPYDFHLQQSSPPHYLGVRLAASDARFADLGEAALIDRQVAALRAEVAVPPKSGTRPSVPAAARLLYQQLLQPLEGKQLAGGRYLADFDGALGLLPVEALADATGHYLIDSTEWRYLSASRTLLRAPSPTRAGGAALILASPGFDADSHAPVAVASGAEISPALRALSFTPLPETLEEARLVASAIGRSGAAVDLVTGDSATPERLLASHGPRYLHIASHGFFLEEAGTTRETARGSNGQTYMVETIDSGRSGGIALAGANRGLGAAGHGEGVLLTEQLRQLDLEGTELAVLSACETGVGSPRIGESILSLRQALEAAGARSTVASLWRVASQETRDTMGNFYDGLAKGRGKAAALRQAKLAIKARQAHPFYWAPFVVTGAD